MYLHPHLYKDDNLVILICMSVGCQAFGLWLIGHLNKSPFGLTYSAALLLYACVQIGNGVFLFIYGLFLPRMVTTVSERVSNNLNSILVNTNLFGIVNTSAVQLMFHFGNVQNILFRICSYSIRL